MEIHERTFQVSRAGTKARRAFWEALEGEELTDVEVAQIISELLSGALKSALRRERRPEDPAKPADEE